jgi:hypothetical protein
VHEAMSGLHEIGRIDKLALVKAKGLDAVA